MGTSLHLFIRPSRLRIRNGMEQPQVCFRCQQPLRQDVVYFVVTMGCIGQAYGDVTPIRFSATGLPHPWSLYTACLDPSR